ncbi:cell division control protein 6 [Acrasis kona]|uniref:Cell division control protein 6 n=1 Tax=Acrasis kona TaxID=1008807 RepID=A0AAW2ZN87_9EUKA
MDEITSTTPIKSRKRKTQNFEAKQPQNSEVITETTTFTTPIKNLKKSPFVTTGTVTRNRTTPTKPSKDKPTTPVLRDPAQELPTNVEGLTWEQKISNARKALSRDGLANFEFNLHGREQELKQFTDIISNTTKKGIGSSIFVSGQPGTGKTTLITQVINRYPNTTSILLNCMSCKTEPLLLKFMCAALFLDADEITFEDICREVRQMKDNAVVLILDEVEALPYELKERILEMTTSSSLIVVGIANELVGETVQQFNHKITFCTYKKDAIKQILYERIRLAVGDGVLFNDAAVNMIANKCLVEGGVRTALDVAKKCLSECKEGSVIGLANVNAVYSKYYTSTSKFSSIKALPFQQKLLLCASWLFKEHQGVNQTFNIGGLINYFKSLSAQHNIQIAESDTSLMNSCKSLVDQSFLKIEKKKVNESINTNSIVSALVSKNDLEQALNGEVTLFKNILEAKWKGVPSHLA